MFNELPQLRPLVNDEQRCRFTYTLNYIHIMGYRLLQWVLTIIDILTGTVLASSGKTAGLINGAFKLVSFCICQR